MFVSAVFVAAMVVVVGPHVDDSLVSVRNGRTVVKKPLTVRTAAPFDEMA